MTKQQLQKELLEKVKPGTKPSHLKKLKRSKSAGDIPTAPPWPKTQSNPPLTNNNPPPQLLSDQLQTKQQEIEELRKSLELTHQALNSLQQNHASLLDDNLTLKHQALKDWWQQYQQTKHLDTELKENIDQAANELLLQDKTISQLRSQITKLQQTNQSLQKDLNLATKLAEFRKSPLPTPDPHSDYSQLMIYACLAVWLIALLNKSWQAHFNDK